MENEKKTFNKKILIGIIAAIIVVVVVVVFLVLRKKEESYRVIKVYDMTGETTVTRGTKGDIDAYINMLLQSGDEVFVSKGMTTLKLDDDKYVYAEESTRFNLEAAGTKTNSRTTIELKEGAITNDIQNKLSDDSSYEINTENSNMSVRGTVYRVAVYVDENGHKLTKLSVFSGAVATKLKDDNGEYTDEVLVERTKEIIIREDPGDVRYETDIRDIDYDELPEEVLEILVEKVENENLDIVITADELREIIDGKKEEAKGPFTVTFLYNDTVFGTQIVEKGECATEPELMPAATGNWLFDFSQPITEDVEIEWR